MNILFSQEVGTYLREAREREPADVLKLASALRRLAEDDDRMIAKIPHTKLDDDIYFLGIGGFIVTVVKRPSGDLFVTSIAKGMLADESMRGAG